MTKLRRVTCSRKEYEAQMEEVYNNCKWCRHSACEDGQLKCFNRLAVGYVGADSFDIYKVAEEGKLDEVLSETLGSMKKTQFSDLEIFLREKCHVSEKKLKEFWEEFQRCLENYHDEIRPHLDEAIDRLYQNEQEEHLKVVHGFPVREDFRCKYFD